MTRYFGSQSVGRVVFVGFDTVMPKSHLASPVERPPFQRLARSRGDTRPTPPSYSNFEKSREQRAIGLHGSALTAPASALTFQPHRPTVCE